MTTYDAFRVPWNSDTFLHIRFCQSRSTKDFDHQICLPKKNGKLKKKKEIEKVELIDFSFAGIRLNCKLHAKK